MRPSQQVVLTNPHLDSPSHANGDAKYSSKPCPGPISRWRLPGAKRGKYAWTPPDIARWRDRTFNGFIRPDGPAGTANHWIVIPLVFCENRNLAFMREALVKTLGYEQSTPYQTFAGRPAGGNLAGRGLAGGRRVRVI